MTMALVITTDVIPLRQRPKYQTIISAAFGLGGVFGPLTGGLIAERTTWRVRSRLPTSVRPVANRVSSGSSMSTSHSARSDFSSLRSP